MTRMIESTIICLRQSWAKSNHLPKIPIFWTKDLNLEGQIANQHHMSQISNRLLQIKSNLKSPKNTISNFFTNLTSPIISGILSLSVGELQYCVSSVSNSYKNNNAYFAECSCDFLAKSLCGRIESRKLQIVSNQVTPFSNQITRS